jgi:hypothetical protein
MSTQSFHQAVQTSITQEKQHGVFRKTFEDLKVEIKALAKKLIREGEKPTTSAPLRRLVKSKLDRNLSLELGELEDEAKKGDVGE